MKAIVNGRLKWRMTEEAIGRHDRPIQQDMKLLQLKKEDTGDRKKWRRRIRVAHPSPRMD